MPMPSPSWPNSTDPSRADQLWGVWAAEPPDAVLTARDEGDRVMLDGTKAWCSGAALCTHALVTARLESGERGLFAVDLHQAGVRAVAEHMA